ncbi:MAG: FAD binding domain-containing protein [Dehalococcoidia bacterium]
MQTIEYVAPTSLHDAVSVLAGAGERGRILAGGTDVIVQVREGRRPNVSVLVDVKKVPEANVLTFDAATGLRVGAAVPCYRIYENELVSRLYPALIDSVSLIGGTAIQGRASLGGNLCNSSPAADTIPTLIVLSGICHIAGPAGERTLPVEEFCIGPGRNALQGGGLLVALSFPAPAPRSGGRFLRFIPRNEMDIAVVNAAAHVVLDASRSRIESARIAIGAVAPTPLLLEEAAEALRGAEATEASYLKAGEVAAEAARPISDMRGGIAQRKHLVKIMVKRALEGAVARARNS